MRISQLPIFRYGIALAFVGAALALSLFLQPFLRDGFLIFFLSAVMLAGWFGRTGPGLLAVAASIVVVDYYFIAPYRAFVVQVDEIPYLLAFLSSAVVTSWLGSAHRATEERQKAHLDELFEQSPEAIMLVDLQDRVVRVNKEFTEIFGYKIEEIFNRTSIDLITPVELRADALKNRQRLAQSEHLNIETIRHRKDGSRLNVSEVSFPVIANNHCIGYYVIFRDITADKRATERLQQAQAELAHLSRITTMGELAASIAHEINQPIGAIVTNSNASVRWLKQNPPAINDAEQTLECIVRDANRAAEVIGRIRSLLRKTATAMLPLDMNEVIRDVLALTSYETSRRGATVLTDLAASIPPVLGDRIQLQQVLLNLIINSFDAMTEVPDRAPSILVKSLCDSGAVLVEVHDSGSGWDESHAALMFDPFFTTKTGGIGMGLTISRSIIETHGGRLWAERGTPHGAILRFTLPIARTPE